MKAPVACFGYYERLALAGFDLANVQFRFVSVGWVRVGVELHRLAGFVGNLDRVTDFYCRNSGAEAIVSKSNGSGRDRSGSRTR